MDLLAPVQAALAGLEAERNAVPQLFSHLDLAWPLSIGIVRAGDWASTVPDRLVAEGRYGVRLGESLEDARAAFEHALARTGEQHPWLREHPVAVTSLLLGFPARGAPAAPGRTVRGAHGPRRRSGGALRLGPAALRGGSGSPRCSTARATCGTRTPLDEQVEVADLERCARVYALLALRRCGTRD